MTLRLSKKKLTEELKTVCNLESKQAINAYLKESKHQSEIVSGLIEEGNIELFRVIEKQFFKRLRTSDIIKIAHIYGDEGLEILPSSYSFLVDQLLGKQITQNVIEIGYESFQKKFFIKKALFANDEPVIGVYPQYSYYDSLDKLYEANNKSLEGANLLNVPLTKLKCLASNKLSGAYVKDEHYTFFPESIPCRLERTKEYISPDYVVTEKRITSNGKIISTSARHFHKFERFAKYLKNDLSNAVLVGCDLSSIDLTQYKIDGATISNNPTAMLDRITSISKAPIIQEQLELLSTQNERLSISEYDLFYISDVHLDSKILDRCKTDAEIEQYVDKKVSEMARSIDRSVDGFNDQMLAVLGDISCDFELNSLFLRKLRRKFGNVFLVLGNHDLWGDSYQKQIAKYEQLCNDEKIIFLNNSLCVFTSGPLGFLRGQYYSAEYIEKATIADLRTITNKSRMTIFGGVGYAGLNKRFNSTCGDIYRGAISRAAEVEESKQFDRLYTKLFNAFADRETIIATHNPMRDWSNQTYNPNWIYLSGHTHHNHYVDNESAHVFEDNQIGYGDKKFTLSKIPIKAQYDIFENHGDGIFTISKKEYNEFNSGKRIRGHMEFTDSVIMIKKRGYYLFMCKNTKGYSVLNGGRRSKCLHDPDYCYDHMEELINTVEYPLREYLEYQTQISKKIRSFGGSGEIHGCIVDIDFFTHVFVNPIDKSLHPYYATDVNYKVVYPDLEGLLQNHCPRLLSRYKRLYLNSADSKLKVYSQTPIKTGKVILDKDIYDASRFFSAAQYLSKSKVLRFWLDKDSIRFSNLLDDSSNYLPEDIVEG